MSKRINLLLVEDNPGDADLIEEELKSMQAPCDLFRVSNGVEAMAFLRQEGEHGKSTMPDLILMDLNMPQKGGREVLQEIKTDVTLRKIPVIIMSSSQADHDIEELYDLQASSYIEKPIELERYNEIVRAIDSFWLRVVRYPFKGGDRE